MQFPMSLVGGRSRWSQHSLLVLALFGWLVAPFSFAPTANAHPRTTTQPHTTTIARQRVIAAPQASTTGRQTGLVNVAEGKQATQTNDNPFVYDPYPAGAPANAVDGWTDGNYGNESSAVTWGNNHDARDWWEVDLGGRYPIDSITLWNRTDCCAERLHDFYVLVSDTPFTSNVLADARAKAGVGAFFRAGVAGTTTNIAVNRSGRYVRVQLSQPGILTLAEVQVWSSQSTPLEPAAGPVNLALGKPARQTNVNELVNDPYPQGGPEHGVDGYLDGYAPAGTSIQTWGNNHDPRDWWEVDLGSVAPIGSVEVWNRTDGGAGLLHDFYVLVSNTPFASNNLDTLLADSAVDAYLTTGAAARRTVLAVGRTGRYVRVMLSQPGALSLAEVQVWSAPDSGTISSWGSQHTRTADGRWLDSTAIGEFTYLRPKPGASGITLQGRQQQAQAGAYPVVITRLAMNIGGRVVEVAAGQAPAAVVDGVRYPSGLVELGDGATLLLGSPAIRISTPLHDIVVTDRGNALEVQLTLPRDNTAQGMWGTPNGNAQDDLALPSGATAADAAALAEGWRITSRAASLFSYAPGEGPATYNQANPLLGQIPNDTALAPFVQQARDLLAGTCAANGTPENAFLRALALDLAAGAAPAQLTGPLCAYQISGVVTASNPAGAALGAVPVLIRSPQTQPCATTSDAQGRYRCTLMPLPGAIAPTVAVTATGGLAQSVGFAAQAPAQGVLNQTLNLTVNRPSIRLTINSADAAGAAVPNTPLLLSSANQVRQLTTDANGNVTLLLSHDPGTALGDIQLWPVFPAKGFGVTNAPLLGVGGPVDLSLELTVRLLDAPRWRAGGDETEGALYTPVSPLTLPAVGADGMIYTIGFLQSGSAWLNQLIAFTPSGTRAWVAEPKLWDMQQPLDGAAPVVGGDGTIYVSGLLNNEASLYAINPDGSTRWRYVAPAGYNRISNHPAQAANGTLYLTIGRSTDNAARLVALNQTTGSATWSANYTDAKVERAPLVAPDGSIIVLGSTPRSYTAAGALKASGTSDTSRGTPMLAASGIIYLTAGASRAGDPAFTLALNANLTSRWQVAVGSNSPGALGPQGALYLPTSAGLVKLNPTNGATLWTVAGTPHAGIVIGADTTVYVLTDTANGNTMFPSSALVGISADGQERSRFRLNGGRPLALAMGPDGTIYTSTFTSNNSSGLADDLLAIPTLSSGPAAGWSSAYGNAQQTSRRTP